ncbi:MAG: glycosyltransferase family 2 protein [Microbacter sp.]
MNLERGLVSIGLPAFKSAYFEKALHSLLNQTYPNFEIIVVNDASPDDFDSIMEKYAGDARIQYYKNAVNLGAASLVGNWNKCLDFAKGEFFVLASDDDLYHENFLSEMLHLATKYPKVNLFHARVALIDKNDQIVDLSPLCPEYERSFDFVWHRIKNYRVQYAPDFMCRTEALRLIGGFVDFPSAWCSDDATWFELSKEGGVAYSSDLLFYFRHSGINISSGGYVENKLKANELYQKWLFGFFSAVPNPIIPQSLIFQQIKKYIDQRNRLLLTSEPFWKLITRMLFSHHKFISLSTLIQAFGIKLFSKLNNS